MSETTGRIASAARIAGDYFQHLVAWNESLEALRSHGDMAAVTVEHPDAGNVDDVVVQRRTGPSLYTQVKHAVDATTPVGQRWLMTPRTPNPASSSVLQKFHRSWCDLTTRDQHPELRLITDREIDPNDVVMNRLDRVTELLVPDIQHRRAAEGRALWAEHLEIPEDELVEFLGSLRFETGRSIRSQQQRASTLMSAMGLNSDQGAIDSAVGLIRDWVLRRERTLAPDELRDWARQRVGQQTAPGAVVVVEAIDRDPHPGDADERISFVDAYLGDEPFERRQLRDPGQWPLIGAEIEDAAQRLRSAGTRRVVVRGAMRLPVWFAVGAAFRDVRGFETAGLQKDTIWSSEDLTIPGAVQTETTTLGDGPDAAVAVGIAADPTSEVSDYITAAGLPIGSLVSILPHGGPSPAAVPDSPTAAATAVAARDAVRGLLQATSVGHIHLFLATPGALALLLGHRWNALRPTTVYEHLGTGNGYAPTFLIPA